MMKKIETTLLGAAAFAVFMMGVMITTNVILRLFGLSLPDSVIMVQELMVVAIILPLAAVTAARAHVSVEVLVNQLPARVTQGLILFGWVVGLVAFAPLIYAGWRELAATWAGDSFYFGDLSLPKWPGRLIFLIGMAAFWVRLLLVLIEDSRCFFFRKES